MDSRKDKEGALYLWQLLPGAGYLSTYKDPTAIDPPKGYDLHSWRVTTTVGGTVNEIVVCWKRV